MQWNASLCSFVKCGRKLGADGRKELFTLDIKKGKRNSEVYKVGTIVSPNIIPLKLTNTRVGLAQPSPFCSKSISHPRGG